MGVFGIRRMRSPSPCIDYILRCATCIEQVSSATGDPAVANEQAPHNEQIPTVLKTALSTEFFQMNAPSPSDQDPVTLTVSRRVKRGREAEYEAWLKGINQAAASFPGFCGVNVIRPSSNGQGEYVSIFRFDSYANLKAWEESEIRRQRLTNMPDGVVESEADRQKIIGLEFWFTAPDAPVLAQPPRHKMVIVLIVVIFCVISLLAPIYSALLGGLPQWLRSLVVVIIQVYLMTYLIMPRITRLLSRWLFKKS